MDERENMWVCRRCLMGIECHEGKQATFPHWIDEDDKTGSKCDWCEEIGFDELYELI